MRKKQNVYKPKRNFNIVNNMFTILFSLALVSFFTLIGYSVAKPFAKVGEAEKEKSVSGAETETVPVTETYTAPGDNDTVAYWLGLKLKIWIRLSVCLTESTIHTIR